MISQLFGTDNTAGTTKLPRIPTRIEDLDPADFASTSNNPYIVQEKNISDILCEYQKAIAAKNNKEGLIVELNTHELLALNNVLLIKHGQHSKMMLDFFSEDTLKNIKLDLIDRFKIEDIDFNKNIRDKLDDILKVS
ncbi:hypothetical protein HPULCUR_005366 [Helicostylum pulchrum]|uniref:Uncharacterized protein n=1 Tax=Helicostylum pulchrum TaxID=562976 RepID=A0ABP9XZT9_9FUNG